MRLCGARCVAQGEAVEREKAMDLLRKDVREREESVSDKELDKLEIPMKINVWVSDVCIINPK